MSQNPGSGSGFKFNVFGSTTLVTGQNYSEPEYVALHVSEVTKLVTIVFGHLSASLHQVLQTTGRALLGCHVQQLLTTTIQNGVQGNGIVTEVLGQLLVSNKRRG